MTITGALSERWPGALRPAWIAAWVIGCVAALVLNPDFTSAGHLTALTIGLGIAYATGRHRRAETPSERESAPAARSATHGRARDSRRSAAGGSGVPAGPPRHRPPSKDRMIRRRRRFASVMGAVSAVAVTIGILVLVGPGVVLAHTARSAHSIAVVRKKPVSWKLSGLGDSVPGAADCDCKSFVDLYGAQVGHDTATPVTVSNFGTDGQTTDQLLATLHTGQPVATAVAASDIVTVTIGANDFLYAEDQVESGKCDNLSCFGSTMTTMRQNLDAIVKRIKVLRTDRPTAIIVTDYWNVFQDGSVGRQAYGADFMQTSDTLTKQVNVTIRQVAAAEKVTFVDLYVPFKGPSGTNDDTRLLASDGDHPSQAGHQLIADTIVAATPMKAVTAAYTKSR